MLSKAELREAVVQLLDEGGAYNQLPETDCAEHAGFRIKHYRCASEDCFECWEDAVLTLVMDVLAKSGAEVAE